MTRYPKGTWSDDQDMLLLEMRREGHRFQAIADRLDRSLTATTSRFYTLNKRTFPYRNAAKTVSATKCAAKRARDSVLLHDLSNIAKQGSISIETIARFADQGLSARQIAEVIGLSKQQVLVLTRRARSLRN